MLASSAYTAPIKRFELWLRKRMPSPVRYLLRVGNHMVSRQDLSLHVPPHLFADCRVCASRLDILKAMPQGGCVAEIGTDQGNFARHILKENQPSELHLVDIEFSRLAKDVATDPAVKLHGALSHLALESFPDASFDWIYLDADHSYEATLRDANAAASKVKPGGYLVFNDFAHIDPQLGRYGVHRAVVQFAVENDWPFVWWSYATSAVYDVALKRPA
ncbi:hypothetical protein A7A08_00887 [Methyloligella halotolerans]|uniref:Class I SAM-dependent methyltransferase n=1 Tax=Methyloligella halotolerans TaxID=1177755 RepID=A0A1E2S3N2_9HYPH|nr:class I SAM-dependent methyltransferase [Methyloligella halotolerans]ODA69051.1 hypothetical protein A7A08_00887 [Methyloligella halotolerans]